jgi:hypothetical protein
MEEVSIAWATQMVHVSEALGKPGVYAALTRADEASYRVEGAAKKVAAALPSTGEAVTHFIASLGMVRTAAGEDNEQRAVGAIAEDTASENVVIAACHANTVGG